MSRQAGDVQVSASRVPPGLPRAHGPPGPPSDAAKPPPRDDLRRPPVRDTPDLRPHPTRQGASSGSSATPQPDDGRGNYDRELSSTVILEVTPYTIVPLELCNCLFMIGSAVVFCIALYIHFTKEPTTSETSSRTYFIMILMHMDTVVLVAAAIVFAMASVGLVGCLRQNVLLLTIYNNFLFVCVLLGSASTVAITFLPNHARKYVKEHVTEDYILNYRENDDFQKVVDNLQASFKCCGVTENSFRDWDVNAYFRCAADNPSAERCSVPFSCCRRENVTVVNMLCGRGVLSLTEQDAWKVIYTRGCADAVYSYVASHLVAIVCCSILFNLAIILLYTLSSTVVNQVAWLSHIYGFYYARVYHGQARMARRYQELEEEPSKDPLLVLQGKYEKQRRQEVRPARDERPDKKRQLSAEAWNAQGYFPIQRQGAPSVGGRRGYAGGRNS